MYSINAFHFVTSATLPTGYCPSNPATSYSESDIAADSNTSDSYISHFVSQKWLNSVHSVHRLNLWIARICLCAMFVYHSAKKTAHTGQAGRCDCSKNKIGLNARWQKENTSPNTNYGCLSKGFVHWHSLLAEQSLVITRHFIMHPFNYLWYLPHP